jgi:mono/diheme cytochrome c family protein
VICLTAMSVGKRLAILVLMAGCTEGVRASKDGAMLYQVSCVTCHGMDGQGTDFARRWNVPDLSSGMVQAKSDDELLSIIKNGRNQMPPWGGAYSEEQLQALVAHLRTLKR